MERLFLSVGAMKAGTTWLHRQLAGHPDIHFCPEKEIHYFADPQGHSYMSLAGRLGRFQRVVRNIAPERLNPHVQRNLGWYARNYLSPQVGDDWYRKLFDMRPARKSDAPWVADFSNLYATLDGAGWAHVHRVAREVRAVYTMRHPSERLWSNLKFFFEFAGRAEALDTLGDAEIASYFEDPGTRRHADYATITANLRSALGDRVAFFFFENTRERPLETLRGIERFLGIAEHGYRADLLETQVNPTRSMAVPRYFADRAEAIRQEQCDRLAALGFEVPQAWHSPLGT